MGNEMGERRDGRSVRQKLRRIAEIPRTLARIFVEGYALIGELERSRELAPESRNAALPTTPSVKPADPKEKRLKDERRSGWTES